MDLKEIYKYIIDKGDLFGIVCVVILIVLVTLLSGKKAVSDQSFRSLIRFLTLFFVISLVFIIALRLSGSSTKPATVSQSNPGSIREPGATKLRDAPLPVPPGNFTVDNSTVLQFTRDGRLLVLQKTKEAGKMATDTPVTIGLKKISKIKVDGVENQLVIYHDDPNNEPYRVDFSNKFDERPLHSYLDGLNEVGYNIQYEHTQKGFLFFMAMCFLFALVVTAVTYVVKFFFF